MRKPTWYWKIWWFVSDNFGLYWLNRRWQQAGSPNTVAIAFTLDPRKWKRRWMPYGPWMPGFSFGPIMVWVFDKTPRPPSPTGPTGPSGPSGPTGPYLKT